MNEIITQFNNVAADLQFLEDVSDMPLEKLCKKCKVTETEWLSIKHEEVEPTKEQLENIYNYAYSKHFDVNKIHYEMALDEFNLGSNLVLTHGSTGNIKGPIRVDFQKGQEGASNDFEYGFYLGESLDQAGCWVANEPNASMYLFLFDTKDLVEAKFELGVEWFIAVSYFRHELPEKYLDTPLVQRIAKKVDECDFITAPIADNALFDIIDKFINGEITDKQATYSMATTHLGFQRVLKTEKCLDHLIMLDHLYMCSLNKAMYINENESEMGVSNLKSQVAMKKYKGDGSYINEIVDFMPNDTPKFHQVRFTSDGVRSRLDLNVRHGEFIDVSAQQPFKNFKVDWYEFGDVDKKTVTDYQVLKNVTFVAKKVSPPTLYKIEGNKVHLSNIVGIPYDEKAPIPWSDDITEVTHDEDYALPPVMNKMFSGFKGEVLDLRKCDGQFVSALDKAFYDCPNLKELWIPSSINIRKTLHRSSHDGIYWTKRAWVENIFSNCPQLEQIICNRDWFLEFGGWIKNVNMFDGDEKLPNYNKERITGKYAISTKAEPYGYFTYIPVN